MTDRSLPRTAPCLALAAGLCVLAACSAAKPAGPPSPVVHLSLDRAPAGTNILATIDVTDAQGHPLTGVTPTISATGGQAAEPVAAAGTGATFTSTVVPDAVDTEVVITAHAGTSTASITALALATVDASLGQPEAVPGLVNTPGWEDGEAISPDGQWLIVSSYVPLDLLSCMISGNMNGPSCTTIRGPTAAPDRPGMLGASRIHDGTYDEICPALGITSPLPNVAFFPTAAYGFHRQADGSFAEPFVIGFDADGCLGPFGYSFTGAPSGTSAGLVFAFDDPFDNPDTKADLYFTNVALGQPNLLGKWSLVNGQPTVTGFVPTKLPPVLSTRQGNPAYDGSHLWWDDEDLPQADRDLSFATLTGTLPNVTAGPAKTVAVSRPGKEDIQPVMDGQDLYWYGDGTIYRATLTDGADPSLAASWSKTVALLGPASQAASIAATGEPGIAHVGGRTELYFVFIRHTAAGYDADIGRVVVR